MPIKKTYFFLLAILIFYGLVLGKPSIAARDEGVYTYRFHLYFDSGKLVADRDYKFVFDLIAEQYAPPAPAGTAYGGEVISINGQKLATFQFYLGNILQTGKGKLSVTAPYYADAKTVNFLDPQGGRLFSVDVAPAGSVCNDNGTCESSVGESYLNCPNDCPAPATPTPGPTIMTPAGPSGLQLVLIYAAAAALLIIVVLVIWFIIKKKRKSAEQQNLPPSSPVT